MRTNKGFNVVPRIRRRIRPERGAAAVEFAIVAPLLFMLVFGIIDFGFGFHSWNAIENASREGARVGSTDASLGSGVKVSHINSRVQTATSFLTGTRTVLVTCSTDGGTNFAGCDPDGSHWQEGWIIRVKVDYNYDYMTPLPTMVGLGSVLHESATSESRFEGN